MCTSTLLSRILVVLALSVKTKYTTAIFLIISCLYIQSRELALWNNEDHSFDSHSGQNTDRLHVLPLSGEKTVSSKPDCIVSRVVSNFKTFPY